MIDITMISAKDVGFEAESGSMSQKVGQENSSDCPQFSDILAESVDSQQASDTRIGEDLNADQAVNNQLDNNHDEGITADYVNIQDLAASVQAIAMQIAQRIQMEQQTTPNSFAKQETSESGFMPISGVSLDMQLDSSSEAVVQSFAWQQVSSKTSQPQMNVNSADSKSDSEEISVASQPIGINKNTDGIDSAGLNSHGIKLGHKLHSNWKGQVPQGSEEKFGDDAADAEVAGNEPADTDAVKVIKTVSDKAVEGSKFEIDVKTSIEDTSADANSDETANNNLNLKPNATVDNSSRVFVGLNAGLEQNNADVSYSLDEETHPKINDDQANSVNNPNFGQTIADAARGIRSESVDAPRPEVNLTQKIIDNIVKDVRLHKYDGRNDLVVRLSPPELGTIRLHLIQDAQGITSQITASSNSVSRLLQANLPTLTEALRDAGLRVESVEVNAGSPFGSFAQDAPFQDAQGRQNFRPRHRISYTPEITPMGLAVNATANYYAAAGVSGHSWLA